jgi:hypothetical protein
MCLSYCITTLSYIVRRKQLRKFKRRLISSGNRQWIKAYKYICIYKQCKKCINWRTPQFRPQKYLPYAHVSRQLIWVFTPSKTTVYVTDLSWWIQDNKCGLRLCICAQGLINCMKGLRRRHLKGLDHPPATTIELANANEWIRTLSVDILTKSPNTSVWMLNNVVY